MIRGTKETAQKYLCKGVRKTRWRTPKKWEVKNKVLMGLLKVEDLKISEFAELIGVHPRTVNSWIYEGIIPKQENLDKVCAYFNKPKNLLFYDLEGE